MEPTPQTPSGSPFAAFAGRRVLVTGHTGFKGAWLSEWLLQLGATVSGIALEPEAPHSLFETLGLPQRMQHVPCDIRDDGRLSREVLRLDPEIVFHLAAQPLVRRSYREPVATWATNVMGTLHLLEAVGALSHSVSVVAVTTDKVYRNREWVYSYRESDELGGRDPYSSSKAACEIAVASWRASFASEQVRVATARAGNVLGGGDRSEDRIVPDCYRAWSAAQPVVLRNGGSTRPWQHVLEPLSGYLRLALHLEHGAGERLESCNFGPGADGDRTVGELVAALASHGTRRSWNDRSDPSAPHEARSLSLAIDLARHRLGWCPALSFTEMVRWVDAGYSIDHLQLPALIRSQIAEYERRATG